VKNKIVSIVCLMLLLVCLSGCSSSHLDSVATERITESAVVAPDASIKNWTPSPMDSFQIQFSGEIDLATDSEVIDLDAFDTNKAIVDQLQRSGKKVICYINAGSWEDWRSDADSFPPEVIGKAYEEWPGENWLDVRTLDELAPILSARLDMCKSKGFDGVEFDNMDGYQNDTGFDLTAADQLTFNRWLADSAHARGLSAGMKNDPEQIADLEPWFDFVILESCFEWGWCELSAPFARAGKAIFDIEYSAITTYCKSAADQSITLIGKNKELDEELKTCP
jgi:hypothetical protein